MLGRGIPSPQPPRATEEGRTQRVSDRKLKPGDLVEVRSPAEILSTLDSDASIDSMPYMGEMLQYSGMQFNVSHRVEKICDTVSGGPPNSRRMHDIVLLDDLRCDGSAHGGCQAGCRIYWKESWLRRIDEDSPPGTDDDGALARLGDLAANGARVTRDVEGVATELYRCQATEALRASESLSAFDLSQYVRELTSGNVGWWRFLRVAARGLTAFISRSLRLPGIRRRLQRLLRLPSNNDSVSVVTRDELRLQPGSMVQVRTPAEIAETLSTNGKTRGLWYDKPEMAPYSGGCYRVKDRVQRIIDESSGQMLEISSDCVILEDVVCSGDHSTCRWFCPRGIYPFWREAWLRRVDDPDLGLRGAAPDRTVGQ